MVVRILLNPILASVLLMVGVWLATFNVSFSLLAVVGSLLLGFSTLRHDVETMHQKRNYYFMERLFSCCYCSRSRFW